MYIYIYIYTQRHLNMDIDIHIAYIQARVSRWKSVLTESHATVLLFILCVIYHRPKNYQYQETNDMVLIHKIFQTKCKIQYG